MEDYYAVHLRGRIDDSKRGLLILKVIDGTPEVVSYSLNDIDPSPRISLEKIQQRDIIQVMSDYDPCWKMSGRLGEEIGGCGSSS